MNWLERTGLIVMVTALAITVGVLGYDAHLELAGFETISEHMWSKLEAWKAGTAPFPILVFLLPLGVSMQAVGLFLHFLGGLIK